MKKLFPVLQLCVKILLTNFIILSPTVAQICTGSLGDPVVNVDFGAGSGAGASLPGSTTSYFFTTSSCPMDGFYTIVNSTSGCFGNSWHSILKDHTLNDEDGYMMLVNASVTPGDFYIDTVKNLCAGTTYEFGAWITNVILPSACNGSATRPQLTFKIETVTGALLGTYNTGDISANSTPIWNQYGFFFTTPLSNSTVVIRITNNAPGGCGNDLALDDITFRPCGPTITAGSAVTNQPIIDLCIGDTSSTLLSAKLSSGYTSPSYQWQFNLTGNNWVDIPGATTLTYLKKASGTGVYKYRLAVAESTNIGISNCRVASNEVIITVHDLPIAIASNNGPVCEKTAIILTASGGATYSWTGPAGFTSTQPNPTFITTNNSSGQYTVIVSDPYGCVDTTITSAATLALPNALVSSNQSICLGDSVALQASGGAGYLWTPGNGLSSSVISNPMANPNLTTTFIVTVTGNNNCIDTASVLVTVNNKPIVSAGEDKFIIKGQSVLLNGTVSESAAVDFLWSPSLFLNDARLLQPVSAAAFSLTYLLTATSTLGCGIATDTVLVKVFNDIYIPNAFTPNDDGLNDTWQIQALAAFPKAVITVFDRYGKKVFESTTNKPWDGNQNNTKLSAGAYPYIIDLKTNRPVLKGMVMIVR